jgi:hypothetical protein
MVGIQAAFFCGIVPRVMIFRMSTSLPECRGAAMSGLAKAQRESKRRMTR